jgi:hypothetical protein
MTAFSPRLSPKQSRAESSRLTPAYPMHYTIHFFEQHSYRDKLGRVEPLIKHLLSFKQHSARLSAP